MTLSWSKDSRDAIVLVDRIETIIAQTYFMQAKTLADVEQYFLNLIELGDPDGDATYCLQILRLLREHREVYK